MKEIKVLIIFSVCCILAIFFFTHIYTSSEPNTSTADGFTISKYKVLLNVEKNNKVNVIEEITTDWYETGHHGIYKFTPEWLEYTDKNGKTHKRKSIISEYKAIGDKYFVSKVNNKYRLQIGSSSKEVDLGEKTYTVAYQYDMGKDPYKKFDEFIFHAFGDYWGTPINNASIELNMPKNIEKYPINFFTDKYRKNNVNDFVNYYTYDNKLIANFDGEKYKNEKNQSLNSSLTVDVELPEGYFEGGSWNYGYKSLSLCIIIVLITVWQFLRWLKYGKDLPKYVDDIEYYPPNNLDSAEIGYIYGKQKSKKLTISIIIDLASKGFIKIDELDKKQIQITNMHSKPKKPIKNKPTQTRQITIKKLKESDDFLNSKESMLMKYLFRHENIIQLDTNIDTFLEVKDKLVQNKYIEILNDNLKEVLMDSENIENKYKEELKEYDKKMIEYNNSKLNGTALSKIDEMVYQKLFVYSDVIILSEHETFYEVFKDVDTYLKDNYENLVNDEKSSKKAKQSIYITLSTIVIFLFSFFIFQDLDPEINTLYILSFICIFINIFLTFIMKRRTDYGEKLISKIKSFRNFLITAEKPQLEELVSENPKYYYNILPYTYVLNISKKWIKKFENIPMPIENNISTYSVDLFNDFNSNIHIPSNNGSSSGGGCSSCGGGCSSCGGGCSSCGGGGSW